MKLSRPQIDARRAGGRARGWEERKRALELYNLNPHFCKFCRKPIEVGNQRVADVIKKQFCNSSHAATYNNLIRQQVDNTPASTAV